MVYKGSPTLLPHLILLRMLLTDVYALRLMGAHVFLGLNMNGILL